MAAMDMEIWNPAIPQLQGTKPFEQIPFLVSLFNGQEFQSYYMETTGDGREEFAERLVDLCGPYASLLVYDKTLEAVVLDNLSSKFPGLAGRLQEIKSK